MSLHTTRRSIVSAFTALAAGILIWAGIAYAGQGEKAAASSPQAPDARDASLELRPVGSAPQNGGTVNPGTKFTLELWLKPGSNSNVTAQQSYMTFDNEQLQVVNPGGSGCTPVSTVTHDSAVFDAVLQNEVCNGPGTCDMRGVNVPPGSLGIATGALSNPPAGPNDFRVASLTFCATAGGRATISWQFAPPDPITRDTQVIDADGNLVHNATLFRDYVINVTGPTPTPNPAAPTATPTHGTGPTPTACAMAFSDVRQGDPFYEDIGFMYCRNVVSGYSDGSFKPYAETLRAQIAKMVVLAFGFEINTEGGPHFTDVPRGHQMYDYIETAYNLNLVSGYSGGVFKPWDNVKRGQIAKIVVLAAGRASPGGGWDLQNPSTASFRDVPSTNEFYRYVETARAHNMIDGFSDGTFGVYNFAKRGQICKIITGALTGQ